MKTAMTPLQILENIPEGVFAVDPNCVITYFNQKAEEITGYPRARIIGKRCADVFRTENCGSRCTIRHSMIQGKEILDYRVNILDRAERPFPVRIQASPLRDDQGTIIGGLQTFRVIENPDEETRRELVLFELRSKIGRDGRLSQIYEILPDLAQSDAPVLLQGEPGTEKKLLARAIHLLSARASGPYVAVVCAEKDPETLTKELLGSRACPPGGDPSNRTKLEGYLEQAHRGTLFLEGIESLAYPLQVSVFKAMEEGEYMPLDAEEKASSDFRLIASTHIDLESRVKEGTFPDSLFYCLNVFQIHLPPLRERREEIPRLARNTLWRLSMETGKDVTDLDEEVAQRLQRHPFYGNLHELDQILRQAHRNCNGPKLTLADLPSLPDAPAAPADQAGVSTYGPGEECDALEKERERILDALVRNRWNRKQAARELGMDRTTLWRRMRRVGIHPGARQGGPG
jgi:PAS domain S-box-containing protein